MVAVGLVAAGAEALEDATHGVALIAGENVAHAIAATTSAGKATSFFTSSRSSVVSRIARSTFEASIVAGSMPPCRKIPHMRACAI